MQARIERLAPGFGSRILSRRVLGPRELEARDANLIGGAINGGTSQLHQELIFRPLPGMGRAETPVRGLFLGSASAHPGGGVHGAPGMNAARAALAHDRLRRLRPGVLRRAVRAPDAVFIWPYGVPGDMRALTWQGKRSVSVETVPDPTIQKPNDADHPRDVHRDLRLGPPPLRGPGPFLSPGDVLGHETMGVVEEVGPEAGDLKVGDRVVVPFNISCGHCWMCSRGLFAQCETTQVTVAGQGRVALRLHRPVRLGAGRPGGVPPRARGAVRAGQGARGHGRRALPLPLRHPADRLAGLRVRRRATRAAPWRCSASGRWAS